MRLVNKVALLGAIAGIYPVSAQVCPAGRIPPAGHVAAALDDASCRLSDGSRFTAYRLDLPSRGTIGLILASSGFILMLRDAGGVKLASGTAITRPIEAGSYTVVVNAPGPDDAGAFTLDTTFAAEPGMICSKFPPLGLNQSVTATLGAAGCVTPGGVPYDGWSVATYGSGTLSISLPQAAFGAVLILRDAQGHVVASGTNQLTAPVDEDSQYVVVVSTGDQAGPYQLDTSFQPGDGETCRALHTFSGADYDGAAINENSCVTTANTSGDLRYFNYYQVTASAAGLAQVTVNSRDFAPAVQLLDASGAVVAIDTGTGDGQQSQIRAYLPPGEYLIRVLSDTPAGGYTLRYDFDTTTLPAACPPVSAVAGDALLGTLASASCPTRRGAADFYRLTLPGSGTLDLTLSTSAFTGRLAIRDLKQNLIVADEDVQQLGVVHISADLSAGDYLVAAESVFGSGDYQLATALGMHPFPDCGYVQPLAADGGFIQKLGVNPCRGANGQPLDLYEFVLPSDAVVAGIMTSSQVDGFLTLTRADGAYLRSNRNGYGPNDPLIVEYLPAGVYRLAARAFSSTVGGYYEVDVRNLAGARPGFCTPRGDLDAGGFVNGVINFAGCQYPGGAFADIYRILLPQDAPVDLRLDSGDFDAYLVLLDSWGGTVDEDDDSGTGTNARISRTLSAGMYYAVARPASDYASAGRYTLSLSAQQ